MADVNSINNQIKQLQQQESAAKPEERQKIEAKIAELKKQQASAQLQQGLAGKPKEEDQMMGLFVQKSNKSTDA